MSYHSIFLYTIYRDGKMYILELILHISRWPKENYLEIIDIKIFLLVCLYVAAPIVVCSITFSWIEIILYKLFLSIGDNNTRGRKFLG